MNCFRFSASSSALTCSAETVVPRITNRSTPGPRDDRGQLRDPVGRQRPGHRHPGGADLGDPLGDEVGLDRLGVELLHPGVRLQLGQLADLLEAAAGSS